MDKIFNSRPNADESEHRTIDLGNPEPNFEDSEEFSNKEINRDSNAPDSTMRLENQKINKDKAKEKKDGFYIDNAGQGA